MICVLGVGIVFAAVIWCSLLTLSFSFLQDSLLASQKTAGDCFVVNVSGALSDFFLDAIYDICIYA